TLVAGLDAVDASHVSPYGAIASRWNVSGGKFTWDIAVPVNVTATLHVPAGKPADVLENGRPLSESATCRVVGAKDGRVIVEIPSGQYRFASTGFSVVTEPNLVATPRIVSTRLSDEKPIPVELSCSTEGATIRYTTDGTAPTGKSRVYDGTLTIAKSAIVRAKAFKQGSMDSYEARAEVEIHPRRIPVQNITLVTAYSPKYPPANGERALIDREEGSSTFSDRKWVGYEAGDMEVILDMGKPTAVRRILMRFVSSPNSWIFLPEAIEVGASNTMGQFAPAANVRNGVPKDVSAIQKYAIPLKNVEARYLKIKVKNYGKCPDWHNSPGGAAWIFVDEIFVE
ncbi:MAG: beta-hexosaminidase precursor, partial [candidate division NC10 bacterium]|nr:beta-hexosaminidase precursor [candidate division NC10 bacterium]